MRLKPPKSGITPAPGDEPVVVEIMNGPEDGREIICDGFPITIGREKESTVRLQCDHLVSRNHARITKSDVGFILRVRRRPPGAPPEQGEAE
jgi:hypothetical protein